MNIINWYPATLTPLNRAIRLVKDDVLCSNYKLSCTHYNTVSTKGVCKLPMSCCSSNAEQLLRRNVLQNFQKTVNDHMKESFCFCNTTKTSIQSELNAHVAIVGCVTSASTGGWCQTYIPSGFVYWLLCNIMQCRRYSTLMPQSDWSCQISGDQYST